MTFDEWWEVNQFQYSRDSLHMSEYHMASVVWAAAVAAERDQKQDDDREYWQNMGHVNECVPRERGDDPV